MTFNPFEKPEYSPAQVARFFGKSANGAEANKLFRENKPLYDSLRKQAVALGLVAARPVYADPDYRRRFEPRQFTAEELRVRNLYSEAEVRAFFTGSGGGKDNPAELMKADPQKYADMRTAATSYNVLDAVVPKPEKIAPTRSADRFPLSESYAKSFGLEPGTPVTEGEFLSMVRVLAERTVREEAEQAAASKKEMTASATAEQAKKVADAEALAAALQAHDRKTAERPLAALAGPLAI